MVKILIAWVLIGLRVTVAWGVNIYKFATLDFERPYKAEVLRGVGIPAAPLGIVIGFMDIGEEEEEEE